MAYLKQNQTRTVNLRERTIYHWENTITNQHRNALASPPFTPIEKKGNETLSPEMSHYKASVAINLLYDNANSDKGGLADCPSYSVSKGIEPSF